MWQLSQSLHSPHPKCRSVCHCHRHLYGKVLHIWIGLALLTILHTSLTSFTLMHTNNTIQRQHKFKYTTMIYQNIVITRFCEILKHTTKTHGLDCSEHIWRRLKEGHSPCAVFISQIKIFHVNNMAISINVPSLSDGLLQSDYRSNSEKRNEISV